MRGSHLPTRVLCEVANNPLTHARNARRLPPQGEVTTADPRRSEIRPTSSWHHQSWGNKRTAAQPRSVLNTHGMRRQPPMDNLQNDFIPLFVPASGGIGLSGREESPRS